MESLPKNFRLKPIEKKLFGKAAKQHKAQKCQSHQKANEHGIAKPFCEKPF
jgi:hypothetical protein